MGKQLAAALNRAIREMEAENKPRTQVVAQMGKQAGIEADAVSKILDGSTNCPPMGQLRAMARALDIETDVLTQAASRDGC